MDDHRTFGDLVCLALRAEPGLDWVGAAHDATDARAQVCQHEPDIVVMDVDLGEVDGLDLTAELRAERPAMLVVVLTAYVDSRILRRAAVAGACALLPKGGPLQELLDGLRNARHGEFYVPASLLLDMVAGPASPGSSGARPPALTPREALVLDLLADGRHVGGIAQDLSISPHTCRGYVKALLSKLGAHSQSRRWPSRGSTGCSVRRDDTDPEPLRQDHRSSGSVLRGALARFAGLSLLAMTCVTLVTLLVADNVARGRALVNAREQGTRIAQRLAAPLVDRDVRAEVPRAVDRLTLVLGNRMQDGSVRHITIWDEEGVVIWSDDPAVMGQQLGLPPEAAELSGTLRATAEISDVDRAAEPVDDTLFEVTVGARDGDGMPLVVQVYLPVGPVEDNARAIVMSFVPIMVGSLVLMNLLVLPLAVSLSRRVQRAEAERATMMRHALLASDLERRRIAEDLHNDVIPELASLGYALPTIARLLEGEPDLAAAQALMHRTTELVQHNMHSLRSMMTEIYPPDLESDGLAGGVRQLVHVEALQAGLRHDIRIADDLTLPVDAARLAYRIIREGLRNVVKHADAEELVVEVDVVGSQVRVRVLDDGRGPGAHPGRSPQGHLGLRLLNDSVCDFGGTVRVTPRAGGGTELAAEFPGPRPEPPVRRPRGHFGATQGIARSGRQARPHCRC